MAMMATTDDPAGRRATGKAPSWTWDSRSRRWCIWEPRRGCWVFEDGEPVSVARSRGGQPSAAQEPVYAVDRSTRSYEIQDSKSSPESAKSKLPRSQRRRQGSLAPADYGDGTLSFSGGTRLLFQPRGTGDAGGEPEQAYGSAIVASDGRQYVTLPNPHGGFTGLPIGTYGSSQSRLNPCATTFIPKMPVARDTPTEPIVKCKINGRPVQAFPDTGAGANYISEGEVKRNDYLVDSSQKSQVKLASGGWTSTLGTVKLSFAFLNESQTHRLEFHVVQKGIQDVIIGSPFLRLTETLSKYWGRITRVFRQPGACRVRFIGTPRQRVVGYLDGAAVCALPDTGADLSLLSTSFAFDHGLTVDRSREHRINIQFADGSMGRTSGIVKDLSWEFGFVLGSHAYRTDFYVYEKLEIPVVLGFEFLYDSKAFTAHAESMRWLEDDEDDLVAHLSIIKVCRDRADGGRRLSDLFRRKKVAGSTVLPAAMDLPVILPSTKVSFHANDIQDWHRAERDMLRRREELEQKLLGLPHDDRSGVQAQLDKWKDDWDLLGALKPRTQGQPTHDGQPKHVHIPTCARSPSKSRGALAVTSSSASSSSK